jgi:hypothetical protein
MMPLSEAMDEYITVEKEYKASVKYLMELRRRKQALEEEIKEMMSAQQITVFRRSPRQVEDPPAYAP